MFGWSKKEKNEKKLNQGKSSLAKLSVKDRGKKLSNLRRRYPRYNLDGGMFDFADELFDMDLVILYLLLSDDMAVEEADVFDNPEPELELEPEPVFNVGQDLVDRVESAVVSDAVVEVEEAVSEATPETVSFDSTSVENSPPVESTPETTSFSDSDSGGCDSGGGD